MEANISFIDLLKPSNLNKSKTINLIKCIAKSNRLPSHCILKLIDCIGSKKLRLSVRLAILTRIIPECRIPEDAVFRITFFLSDLQVDVALKIEILKWMVTILPLLNSFTTKFHCLYEIYLKLLNIESLRPHVIFLLKYITMKKHVTSDRIKYIINLLHKDELQQGLMLNIYNRLQPSLVKVIYLNLKNDLDDFYNMKSQVKSILKHYNIRPPKPYSCGRCLETKSTLLQKINSDAESLDTMNIDSQEVESTCRSQSIGSTQLPQLPVSCSFEEVYRNFQVLEKSSMQQILNSGFRRLLLTSDIYQKYQTSFYDYILSSSWLLQDFNSSLPLILEVLHEKQEPVTEVTDFINRVIDIWDGHSYFLVLLDIVAYQESCCFEKIVHQMNILKKSMHTATLIQKSHLLYCFSRIYQNWAFTAIDFDENTSFVLYGHMLSFYYVQCRNIQVKELLLFSTYIDLFCDDLLAEDDFHPCHVNQVLIHFERICMNFFTIENGNQVFHFPTATLFNSVLFSLNSFAIENLCGILLWYFAYINKEYQNNCTKIQDNFICFLLDVNYILWDKKLPENCTYIPRTEMFTKVEKLYTTFRDLFMFPKHPAFLLKTECFYKDQESLVSWFENVPVIQEVFDNLCENGLKYFVNFAARYISTVQIPEL